MRQLDPSHTVVAIVDNNPAAQGTARDGIPIHPPKDLPRLGPYDFLVIASTYSRSIQAQIESEGLAPPDKVLSVYQTPVRASRLTTRPHPANAYSPELLARIDNRRWYHVIEVQPGCHTPGNVLPQACFLDYPQVRDLTGKRVLDIGAWDGGYTFLAEGRGASVTAYDIQDPDYSGFNTAKDMLGSKANHILGSVYDLNREQHGAYDVVLYFGVFYHLFDPLRAFCAINSVLDAGGYMLFEGAILDHAYNVDATWQPMRDAMEPYTKFPLTYYTSKTYWNNDQSTWFVPNMACLREWIVSAGFEVLETGVIESISRGYGLARKVRSPLPEHEVLQDPSLTQAFA
jgi:tRNA (mo5U34)-methyltransferase